MSWRDFLRLIGVATTEDAAKTSRDLERVKRRVDRLRFHLRTLDTRLSNYLREERWENGDRDAF